MVLYIQISQGLILKVCINVLDAIIYFVILLCVVILSLSPSILLTVFYLKASDISS